MSAVFFANGMGIGIWGAFIPLVKDRLALTDAALAVILFCAAAGAIVAMPVSGALCDRVGSRSVTALAGALFGAGLGAVTAASPAAFAAVAAAAMGAGNGAMDVAMNVNGVTVQSRAARPVMSSLHGLFSVGTFVAAAAVAATIAFAHAPLNAAATGALLIAASSLLLRPLLARDAPGQRRTVAGGRRRRIPARLLLLGCAAICGAVCEGALVDWSGVYLRESLRSDVTAALIGFGAYAVAMSVSRFCGDWAVHRIGPVALVRAGGVTAAAGLALALAVHTYPAVLAGFFIAGIGLGNVSPLVYGAGGETAGTPAGTGVAVVTTLGYAGFLIGPALIGITAQRASIDVAFALIALFAVGIALLAPSLGATRRPAR